MPEAKENKVKFGLENVHYAIQTESATGEITFATPVPIKGAVNLSLSPEGDTTKFYADNVAYYVSAANDGYQGDLEIARVPDSFSTDVLKEELDATDKVLVEKSNVEAVRFALLFEFSGDQRATKHVLYNCTAARPAVSGKTTENSKTPATSTLTLTAAPMADGRVKAKTTANTPAATVSGWYSKVWEPSASGD